MAIWRNNSSMNRSSLYESVIETATNVSQLWINITRSATIGRIAGYIFESAFSIASWAYLWWRRNLNGIAALQTLPERI